MWEENFEDHSCKHGYRWIIISCCGTLKLWKDACMCSKAVFSTIGVRQNSFGITLSMLLLHLSSRAYLSNSE